MLGGFRGLLLHFALAGIEALILGTLLSFAGSIKRASHDKRLPFYNHFRKKNPLLV